MLVKSRNLALSLSGGVLELWVFPGRELKLNFSRSSSDFSRGTSDVRMLIRKTKHKLIIKLIAQMKRIY